MSGQGSLRQPIINIDRAKRERRGEDPDSALDVRIAFINTEMGSGHQCQIQAPNGMNNGDIREYLAKLHRGEFPNLENFRSDLDVTMKKSGVSEKIILESLAEWRESLMGCCMFPEGEKWPLLSRTIFYFFHRNGEVATLEDYKRMRR